MRNAVLLLLHVEHGDALDHAGIGALSAALGEKGRLIEEHAPALPRRLAGEHARGEAPEKAVGVV